MPTDREVSELISRSLSGHLDATQLNQIDSAIQANENLRAFAKLSGLIQSSVTGIAKRSASGDESLGSGLSSEAKDRLKNSVAREQLRRSRAGVSLTATAGLEVSTLADHPQPGLTSRRM